MADAAPPDADMDQGVWAAPAQVSQPKPAAAKLIESASGQAVPIYSKAAAPSPARTSNAVPPGPCNAVPPVMVPPMVVPPPATGAAWQTGAPRPPPPNRGAGQGSGGAPEQELGKFVGKIKLIEKEKGFGFIDCAELKAKGHADAFVLYGEIKDFSVGSRVQFSAYLREDKLRARDVSEAAADTGIGSAGRQGAATAKAGWTKLANGGFKPEVTAKEYLNGPLERIPQSGLEDLRFHLRTLLDAEAERPPPPITAICEGPTADAASAPAQAQEKDSPSPGRPQDSSCPRGGTPGTTASRSRSRSRTRSMLISSAFREGACAAADLLGKRKLEQARVGDTIELYLRQLSFSQDSIKGTFQDGRHVALMQKELQTGEKRVDEIPTIMALVKDGQVYSVDNRRLWSFKNAGLPPDMKIPVVAGKTDKAFFNKFTTPTQGRTVKRR